MYACVGRGRLGSVSGAWGNVQIGTGRNGRVESRRELGEVLEDTNVSTLCCKANSTVVTAVTAA